MPLGIAILDATQARISVQPFGNAGDVIMSTVGIAIIDSATCTTTMLPAGTAGQVLTSNGPGVAPSFQDSRTTTPPPGLGFDGLNYSGPSLSMLNANQTLAHDGVSAIAGALMNAPITAPTYWEVTIVATSGTPPDIAVGVGNNLTSLTTIIGSTNSAGVASDGTVKVNGTTGTAQSAPPATMGVYFNPTTHRLWVQAPGIAPIGAGIDCSVLTNPLFPAVSIKSINSVITINTQPSVLPTGFSRPVAGTGPIQPVTPSGFGFDTTRIATTLTPSNSNKTLTHAATGITGCAQVNAPITAPSYWEITILATSGAGDFSYGVGLSSANIQDDYCGDIGSAAVTDRGDIAVNGTFPPAQGAPPATTIGFGYDPNTKRLYVGPPGISTIGPGTGVDCSLLGGGTCYPMVGIKSPSSSLSINTNPTTVPTGYNRLVQGSIPPPPPPPPPGGQTIPATGATVSAGASAATIQAAINGLAANTKLVLSAGTYNLAGTSLVGKSNIMIYTSGLVTINGGPDANSGGAFNFSNQSGFTVRGDTAAHLVINSSAIVVSNATGSANNRWYIANVAFNTSPSSGLEGSVVRLAQASFGTIINCDLTNCDGNMIGSSEWDNITCDGLHVTGGTGQFCSINNDGNQNKGRNVIFQRCVFTNFGRGVIESSGTDNGNDTPPNGNGVPSYFADMLINNNQFYGYYTQGTPAVSPISIVARAQIRTVVSNNFIKRSSGYGGYTEGIEINSSNGVCDTFGNVIADVDAPFATYGSAGQNAHNNSVYGATQGIPGNNTVLGSSPAIPAAPARIAW